MTNRVHSATAAIDDDQPSLGRLFTGTATCGPGTAVDVVDAGRVTVVEVDTADVGTAVDVELAVGTKVGIDVGIDVDGAVVAAGGGPGVVDVDVDVDVGVGGGAMTVLDVGVNNRTLTNVLVVLLLAGTRDVTGVWITTANPRPAALDGALDGAGDTLGGADGPAVDTMSRCTTMPTSVDVTTNAA